MTEFGVRAPRGEFTVVISGLMRDEARELQRPSDEDVADMLISLISSGMPPSQVRKSKPLREGGCRGGEGWRGSIRQRAGAGEKEKGESKGERGRGRGGEERTGGGGRGVRGGRGGIHGHGDASCKPARLQESSFSSFTDRGTTGFLVAFPSAESFPTLIIRPPVCRPLG